VGFLITGMTLGPTGLALVAEPTRVQAIAELGVIALLFIIGLELSLDQLRHLKRAFLIGGPLQIALTGLATLFMARLFGLSFSLATLLALGASLSSTALVLKLFADRRESETPHARLALAILIFQDVMVVPFLLTVQALAPQVEPSHSSGLPLWAGLLLLLAALAFIRYFLPVFLRLLVASGVREGLLLASITLCLGAAWLTEILGFSLGMGAFFMGLLLGNSDYRAQIEAEALPFRTLFTSLFFIAMGMLVDLPFSLSHLPLILFLTAAVLVLKMVATTLASMALGLSFRVCLAAGICLAQVGEFSFVLFQAGHHLSLLQGDAYQLAIAVTLFSMVLTPLLLHLSGPAAEKMDRMLGRPAKPEETTNQPAGAHVLIVGFGLNGRHLARVLRSSAISYRVVDLDDHRVRSHRAEGEPISYGDATHEKVLRLHGLEAARILVTVISDLRATLNIIRQARHVNKEITIVCRTRFFHEIEALLQAGADSVIAEEYESSIELVSCVLARLHVPGNLIRSQARLLREGGYQMLRTMQPAFPGNQRLLEVLAAGTTETFLVRSGHAIAGQTIAQSALRTLTGASIIALVRGEQSFANPAPEMAIQVGDTLVLVGSHEQIDRAFDFLDRTPAV
jgi:CPA2 family monovalent cation:H+ antiporter-2